MRAEALLGGPLTGGRESPQSGACWELHFSRVLQLVRGTRAVRDPAQAHPPWMEACRVLE